jgi:6,7-dimethyl-8-ribityllumazine synthase
MPKHKSKKKSVKIAVVVSKFNSEITEGLLKSALAELKKHSVADEDIKIIHTPGAFEIPLTAKVLCKSKKYSAVICLGAVIKGETAHFEYISDAVSKAIMQLNMEYNIPVTFGVLTAYTDEQAIKRSSDDENNKGKEAVLAALEMIGILKSMTNDK